MLVSNAAVCFEWDRVLPDKDGWDRVWNRCSLAMLVLKLFRLLLVLAVVIVVEVVAVVGNGNENAG